jgi:hypothetical protein
VLVSISRFSTAARRNFNCATRKIMNAKCATSERELDAQVLQYASTAESCSCGRTDHLTKMYGQEVPCIHQCHLGARRPHCHEIPSLAGEPELDHFLYSATACEKQKVTVPTERVPWLKAVVSDNIRHFSGTRRSKTNVAQWVNQPARLDDGKESGTYTYKVYHFKSRIPGAIR